MTKAIKRISGGAIPQSRGFLGMAEDPARWGPRADKDGEVIAHILATIQNYPPAFETKRYGLVNDLAVASAYRRIGIGQHLFAMVKDWFVTRGIKRIEIEVAVANEVSTSFWAKMDFRPYKEVYYLELQYAPPNKPMNQMS